MRTKWLICALLMCMALGAPSTPLADAGTRQDPGEFAIHLLKDKSLGLVHVRHLNLARLVLEPEPFMTTADITSYSWSDHVFAVTPQTLARLDSLGHIPCMSVGLPFVVALGQERRYLGVFWYGYSSQLPTVPHIMVSPLFQPLQLREGMAVRGDSLDPREDDRVRGALGATGILKE